MNWFIAWLVFEGIMLAVIACSLYKVKSDVELWGEEVEWKSDLYGKVNIITSEYNILQHNFLNIRFLLVTLASFLYIYNSYENKTR